MRPLRPGGTGEEQCHHWCLLKSNLPLSCGNSVRTVASQFGICDASVVRFTDIVSPWICAHYGDWFGMPEPYSGDESRNWSLFRSRSVSARNRQIVQGLPRAVGAIDCTHIVLAHAPPIRVDPRAYIDRKGRYSVQVQAVADASMIFRDVYCGWAGSVHDFRVLRNSPLFARAGHIFENSSFLLGDAGYPPLPWLVPAFREAHLTEGQAAFNNAHSTARNVVERSFGVLKARWRILSRMDVDIERTNSIIAACFVLHNVCVVDSDHYVEVDTEEDETDYGEDFDEHDLEEEDVEIVDEGDRRRDAIMRFMLGGADG